MILGFQIMASIPKVEAHSGTYRVQDPLDNFKFRVCVWRVGPSLISDESGSQQEVPCRRELLEKTFFWQEKVFSEKEVSLYEDEDYCVTPLHRRYHQMITAQDLQINNQNRLFTYINDDRVEEERMLVTTSSVNPSGRSSGFGVEPLTDASDSLSKLEIAEDNEKKMHIMIDLHPTDRKCVEVLLCKIVWYPSGVLRIKPDFSELGMPPYRLEAAPLGGAVYHYRIEHTSQQPCLSDVLNKHLLQEKLYSKQKNMVRSVVGSDFERVSPGTVRLFITGEILSATGFEYEPLYLHYFVDLPKGWVSDKNSSCSGVSQRCKSKTIDGKKVWHVTVPLEIDLVYHGSKTPPSYPCLILMLMSLDWWGRIRTEGYGFISLPTPSGEICQVDTWRPTTGYPQEKLRRYFLGGASELSDPTFAAIPATKDHKCLSRYGLHGISCGQVSLRLWCLRQQRPRVEGEMEMNTSDENLLDFTNSPQQASIKAVMHAFHLARRRMVEARELLC